ncbi:hypothetical protein N7495_003838 [Penicillium taxi]|uniref:uncharacterized protein n=1 Tax=Penicillium taxi TaxID=168475 RepID=UPI002545A4CB|nr:uncharacterized protein N7495_003838 [Penicillium taxi]KAJ5899094.1 hypothetical protein N7495_003838 [Penicillium taxi]
MYASPPAYYSSSMPTSYPMAIPGQANTPQLADEDGISSRMPSTSPSWASPQTPRRRTPTSKAKPSRSPREKRTRPKRRDSKGASREPPLSVPLSELTKYMTDLPIKDMDAWVMRSLAERQREVKLKGKISRPMNSFMLYRSAYAERAKRLLHQTNHQVVSRATGQSWALEPKCIRDKYEELARVERDNHAASHPDYKFKPQKGPATTKRVGELSPPASIMPDPSVSDWEDQYLLASIHHRSRSLDADMMRMSRHSSPFAGHESVILHDEFSSPWNTSYPDPTVFSGSVDDMAHVEDLHYRRDGPLLEMQYGASSSLAGLPGATHDDLIQPQLHYMVPEHMDQKVDMDPRLLDYDPQSEYLPSYAPPQNTYSGWENHVYLPTAGTAASSPIPFKRHGDAYESPSWSGPHDQTMAETGWLENDQVPASGY